MRVQSDLAAALDAAQSAAGPAWLVGGAVRDRLLGRPTSDYDLTVAGDVRQGARAAARAAGGHAFELSEGFGGWRVVPRRHQRSGDRAQWQLDLLPLLSGSIEADLSLRDLTVNALAQPLGSGQIVDPHGGQRDLSEHRLRMVSPQAFGRDPLRTLRLARLACEMRFDVEATTAGEARRSAPLLTAVSPERTFEELRRIVIADDPVRGLGLMDELGVTAVVLPELWELRGVEQSRYHHLDVHAHTMSVLAEAIELERDPQRHLGPPWPEVDALLSAPLANRLTRWQGLRFGALLHDIAKPRTRDVMADGRVTFIGHDAAGAQMAADILTRLRASQRLREHVAALVRHHLRLGFLVAERPLSRRAVYRYLKGVGEVSVDVTVLSIADRLATRGERSGEAISKHLELAQEMLVEALSWRADPPRPPVRGDELAGALGLAPGPALGELLAELEEASFAQEVNSPEQAIDRARELVARQHQPSG